MPVTETQFLGGQRLVLPARDRDRGRRGGPDDAQVRGAHFHVSRGHVRVAHRDRTLRDGSLDEDDGLRTQARRRGRGVGVRRGRIEAHLDEARAVAQVHEDQAAEVAATVDPTRDADGLSNVFRAQGTTRMRAQARGERCCGHLSEKEAGSARRRAGGHEQPQCAAGRHLVRHGAWQPALREQGRSGPERHQRVCRVRIQLLKLAGFDAVEYLLPDGPLAALALPLSARFAALALPLHCAPAPGAATFQPCRKEPRNLAARSYAHAS